MTAEEIRKWSERWTGRVPDEIIALKVQIEIAAQLAELNENLNRLSFSDDGRLLVIG